MQIKKFYYNLTTYNETVIYINMAVIYYPTQMGSI